MGFAAKLQAAEAAAAAQQGGAGAPVQYPPVAQPGYGAPPQQYGAPQPQYGVPPPQAAPQQLPGLDAGSILAKLRTLVGQNGLRAFYPEQRLQALAAEVAAKDLAALGRRWRLPPNMVLDLTALALYDIAIMADDSGSMAFAEQGTRIADLKAMLGRIADAATVFDQDGITVKFMNSELAANNLTRVDQIEAFVSRAQFQGITPLGTMLDRKILRPLVLGPAAARRLAKPVLVIVITDGEPTGEPSGAVKSAIKEAKKQLAASPYGPGAVAFQFAQVGRDADATKFLGKLDTDSSVGGMIDATSYIELEQEEYRQKGIELTVDLYMVKLLCGAIDKSYDEQDEAKAGKKKGSLLGRLFK